MCFKKGEFRIHISGDEKEEQTKTNKRKTFQTLKCYRFKSTIGIPIILCKIIGRHKIHRF